MKKPDVRPKRNAAGKYYVIQKECIMCQVCVAMGDGYFEMDWDEETAYLVSQPVGKSSEKAVREAMLSCPVDAIKDNGEDFEDGGTDHFGV
ncbi:MAG: ferredoxin [Acidobacteria bacterium]|nr:ferredoxin [Acidobacteriota bacterium]